MEWCKRFSWYELLIDSWWANVMFALRNCITIFRDYLMKFRLPESSLLTFYWGEKKIELESALAEIFNPGVFYFRPDVNWDLIVAMSDQTGSICAIFSSCWLFCSVNSLIAWSSQPPTLDNPLFCNHPHRYSLPIWDRNFIALVLLNRYSAIEVKPALCPFLHQCKPSISPI